MNQEWAMAEKGGCSDLQVMHKSRTYFFLLIEQAKEVDDGNKLLLEHLPSL